MTAQSLIHFLKDPQHLLEISYQEINALVEQYPYCQNLRYLLAQKSKLEQHKNYQKDLELAATYSIDRPLLQKQIELKEQHATDTEPVIEEDVLELKELSKLEKQLESNIFAPADPNEFSFLEHGFDTQSELDLSVLEESSPEPALETAEKLIPMNELEDVFAFEGIKNPDPENKVEAPKDIVHSPKDDLIPIEELEDALELEDLPPLSKTGSSIFENLSTADLETASSPSKNPNDNEMIALEDLEKIIEEEILTPSIEAIPLPEIPVLEETNLPSNDIPLEIVNEEELMANIFDDAIDETLDNIVEPVAPPVEEVRVEGDISINQDYLIDSMLEEVLPDEEIENELPEDGLGETVSDIVPTEPINPSLEDEEIKALFDEAEKEILDSPKIFPSIESENVEEINPPSTSTPQDWAIEALDEVDASLEADAANRVTLDFLFAKETPTLDADSNVEFVDVSETETIGLEEETPQETIPVLDKQSFNNWLKHIHKEKETQPIEEASSLDELPSIVEPKLEKPTSKKKKKNKKKKKKKETSLAKKSVIEREEVISQTLADLLAAQGYSEKAIKMYERLSLIFPEKSAFFAQKIKELSYFED